MHLFSCLEVRFLERTRLRHVPGTSLEVTRKEPKRKQCLENSASQGQRLAGHLFPDHKQPLHAVSKHPVSLAAHQKGRRQPFSPSPPPRWRVLPALPRAGARRLAPAAAALRRALGADTPFAWPGAAPPSFSCSLGTAVHTLGLGLERQTAQPLGLIAYRKNNGPLLLALSIFPSLGNQHAQARSEVPGQENSPGVSQRVPACLRPLPLILLPAVVVTNSRLLLHRQWRWGQAPGGGHAVLLVPELLQNLVVSGASEGHRLLLCPPPAQEPPDALHGPAGMGTALPCLSPRSGGRQDWAGAAGCRLPAEEPSPEERQGTGNCLWAEPTTSSNGNTSTAPLAQHQKHQHSTRSTSTSTTSTAPVPPAQHQQHRQVLCVQGLRQRPRSSERVC